jgi:prolyl oligopeptidase
LFFSLCLAKQCCCRRSVQFKPENIMHLTKLLVTSLVFALPPLAHSADAPGKNDHSSAGKTFTDFLESEWNYEMEQNPIQASFLGDRRWNDRWGDRSLEAVRKREEHTIAALARLAKIDHAQLSPADQLNYDLFKKDLETDIEGAKFRAYLMPITQRGGPQTLDELGDRLRFETVKDYEDWVARLRAFPVLMEQDIALMREGARTHVIWPKVVLNRVPAQIDKQLVSKPEESPFFKPFKKFPAAISSTDRERLTKAASEAIASGILPSFQKLKKYFVDEYLPAAFDQVGVWQMPQGAEFYAYLARRHTTTALTPQQIHEKGLSEVARIHAEMQAIVDKVGFKGTLPEFFTKLRTDPQFFYKTPEELLEAYRALAKRIDPNLVKVFKTLPRTPYGVTAIPDNIAPDTTTAYYSQPAADGSRAGTYFVNLYKPETRPKWEMMALSLHESVPGHHLQIALAQELGDIPKFRRYGGYTAYVEGWGLYAESLGEEMGLYDDPYSKFGQLTYEMWRAVRLVVDTGMHQMKWDRQRAINFFMENAPKSENDIVNEIDRYISMPGQALAYKIGELKIKELRDRARREIGESFDVREFHDAVLLSGAVPLDVLERNINSWTATKKAASKQKPNTP